QWPLVLPALLFLDQHKSTGIVYTVTAVAGLGLGTGPPLPYTMLPDVVDEDELMTGIRREGAFYSIFVLLQKIGLATALASSSWILGAEGYVAPKHNSTEPDVQPEAAVMALKYSVPFLFSSS